MKKLLVTLLAASMCLSMLAGCGSKEEETTTTDKETTTSEATTEETEESEVAGDVELKEFTILGDYAVNASYYQMDQFEDFYSVIAFRELMEANGLDIKFELINDDQYITTLQTRFAAMNNVPYFVAMYGLSENEVMQLAAQGVVLDINPMLAEQIAQDVIASNGGAAIPMGGGVNPNIAQADNIGGLPEKEHAIVRNARQKSNEASQPNSDGVIAGNCHKLPAGCFTRSLLGVEEITGRLSTIMQRIIGINPYPHLHLR